MFMRPWESVIYDVKIINVKFMGVNILSANVIQNLFIWYIVESGIYVSVIS